MPRPILFVIQPRDNVFCGDCKQLKTRLSAEFSPMTELYCRLFDKADPECKRLRDCLSAELAALCGSLT